MQNDIHAPATTVYEALEFSAQMRVLDVDKSKLKDFVDQVHTDYVLIRPSSILMCQLARLFACGISG